MNIQKLAKQCRINKLETQKDLKAALKEAGMVQARHAELLTEMERQTQVVKTRHPISDRRGIAIERARIARRIARHIKHRFADYKISRIGKTLSAIGFNKEFLVRLNSEATEIRMTTEDIAYGTGQKYRGDYKNWFVSDVYPICYAPTNIDTRKLVVIGGIPTYLGENQHTWWTKSRGYSVKEHTGYVVGDHHYEGLTREQAEKKDVKRLEKLAKEEKARTKRDSAVLVWVTLQDSFKGGNCRVGTMNFVAKCGLSPEQVGAIRSDYLLELAQQQGVESFARRAIKASNHVFA